MSARWAPRLVAGDRVDLVDDHGVDRVEDLPRLRGQHQVERLGRRDQDVGRVAQHRRALARGRVAGADRHAEVEAEPAQRRPQVALDVIGERLQRGDVDEPGALLASGLGGEAVKAPEERGERLAGSGGGADQDVRAGRDRRPRALLGGGRRLERVREPVANERGEGGQRHRPPTLHGAAPGCTTACAACGSAAGRRAARRRRGAGLRRNAAGLRRTGDVGGVGGDGRRGLRAIVEEVHRDRDARVARLRADPAHRDHDLAHAVLRVDPDVDRQGRDAGLAARASRSPSRPPGARSRHRVGVAIEVGHGVVVRRRDAADLGRPSRGHRTGGAEEPERAARGRCRRARCRRRRSSAGRRRG